MSVKLPSIPPIRGKAITPELTKILTPIKTILENLIVERNNDLAVVTEGNIAARVQAQIDQGQIDIGTSSTGIPFPTGLTAVSDVRGVQLSWTVPSYGNHAYCEVYRHTANDRSAGSLLDTTPGSTYMDTSAAVGTTYYYWVRNKSSGGVYSDFNAGSTAGVSGSRSSVSSSDVEAGSAFVEVATSLPVTNLFDGRPVYIPGASINFYDLTNTQWDTWLLPATVPSPQMSYAYDATATISDAVTAADVVSTTLDVGTGSTKLTTVLITVSCMVESAAAADTSLDLIIDYNGSAVQTDSAFPAADNTAANIRLYTRTIGVTVGAETGSITIKLQGLRIGTDNTTITDTWISAVGQ